MLNCGTQGTISINSRDLYMSDFVICLSIKIATLLVVQGHNDTFKILSAKKYCILSSCCYKSKSHDL